MRNLRNKLATIVMAGFILTGTSFANTGILMSDLTEGQTCNERSKGGILMSDFTGILMSDFTGILMSDLGGILMSDASEVCGSENLTGILMSD